MLSHSGQEMFWKLRETSNNRLYLLAYEQILGKSFGRSLYRLAPSKYVFYVVVEQEHPLGPSLKPRAIEISDWFETHNEVTVNEIIASPLLSMLYFSTTQPVAFTDLKAQSDRNLATKKTQILEEDKEALLTNGMVGLEFADTLYNSLSTSFDAIMQVLKSPTDCTLENLRKAQIHAQMLHEKCEELHHRVQHYSSGALWQLEYKPNNKDKKRTRSRTSKK